MSDIKNKVNVRRFQAEDAEEVKNLIVRNFLEVNSKDYGIDAMQKLAEVYGVEKVLQIASYAHMYVFELEFSPYIYTPRIGIAGSYRNSTFSFENKLHRIFHMATPAYIPTSSVEGFHFLHTLWKILFCRVLNDDHSDQCDMVLH